MPTKDSHGIQAESHLPQRTLSPPAHRNTSLFEEQNAIAGGLLKYEHKNQESSFGCLTLPSAIKAEGIVWPISVLDYLAHLFAISAPCCEYQWTLLRLEWVFDCALGSSERLRGKFDTTPIRHGMKNVASCLAKRPRVNPWARDTRRWWGSWLMKAVHLPYSIRTPDRISA